MERFFFTADNGSDGFELWRTDGSNANTVLVKDINPGQGSSSPVGLINVDGTLFFSVDDGVHGRELWRSDGTSDGTVLVKDIASGSPSSTSLTDVGTIGNSLIFAAADSVHGLELWKSDGSAEGTVLVRDLFPGVFHSYPRYLTNYAGQVAFSAADRVAGGGIQQSSLWISDGTEAGTKLLKEISTSQMTSLNRTLFFSAIDEVHGRELWRSEGTEAGTYQVKDVRPGTGSGLISTPFTVVGDSFFFQASDGIGGPDIYKSDGTGPGTVLVKDFVGDVFPNSLTAVGETLFFSGYEFATGGELWKSDGTTQGTVLIKDIVNGPGSSRPADLVELNGMVFFTAFSSGSGTGLWVSDGTADGTGVLEIGLASSSPFPQGHSWMSNVDGRLFFLASDGANGFEPWVLLVVPEPDCTVIALMAVAAFYIPRNSPLERAGAAMATHLGGGSGYLERY